MKVVKALKRNNNGVIHAAVDMLCALMCVSSVFLKLNDDLNFHKPILPMKFSVSVFPKLLSLPFIYSNKHLFSTSYRHYAT